MSGPIKTGDLVQIVRWPCCGRGLGIIFVVDHFVEVEPLSLACSACGGVHPACAFALSPGDMSTRVGAPVPWLKRIEPLDEPQDAQHEEEATA